MKRGQVVAEIALRDGKEATPVPIVADGAIATAYWGEGRMIPVLILDTSTRPDVENLITAQYRSEIVGDVMSDWTFSHEVRRARRLRKRLRGLPRPLLLLRFTKPSRCVLMIEFDIRRQGVLVDQILWSHGVYLQPGRPGDRVAATVKSPKIVVEVPRNEVFQGVFDGAYRKALCREFRNEGLSGAQAKRAVDVYLKVHRGAFQRRVPFRRVSGEDTGSGDGAPAPHGR